MSHAAVVVPELLSPEPRPGLHVLIAGVEPAIVRRVLRLGFVRLEQEWSATTLPVRHRRALYDPNKVVPTTGADLKIGDVVLDAASSITGVRKALVESVDRKVVIRFTTPVVGLRRQSRYRRGVFGLVLAPPG